MNVCFQKKLRDVLCPWANQLLAGNGNSVTQSGKLSQTKTCWAMADFIFEPVHEKTIKMLRRKQRR